ncbi:hypothetical protein, partial [Plasmodium yoelii yoelii]
HNLEIKHMGMVNIFDQHLQTNKYYKFIQN